MIGSFRTGRWAVALSALVGLFVSPSHAVASGGRVQQTFVASTPAPAAAQSGIQQVSTVASPAQAYAQPVEGVQQVAPVPVQPIQAAPVSVPAPRTLRDMVATFVNRGDQDEEQLCLAKAIYFEARGESLEGQLAVAEVVLNRAASGRYPPTICRVVTQPWQFSFIRSGRFPSLDSNSAAWHTALAVADVARNQLADQIPSHVLWYHANYVSPSWGRRLTRIAQIGAHIFYG